MGLTLVDHVQEKLETERFGQSMEGFETVGSTNTVVSEWARDEAPEGSVAVTEYQSSGRGRHGRSWDAKKGQNLMFSVLLRPILEVDQLGLITVAASVAVAEAIDGFVSPHRAVLKWPNDVFLEGRKTCGMLLESSVSGQQEAEVVVLGVGLNVNQTDFSEDLSGTATSLRLTTGRPVPRAPLFSHLLRRLERRYDAVQRGNAEAVRTAFQDRLRSLSESRTLRIPETGETISGIVRGITETGALRLDTPEGPKRLHAGDVTSCI